MAGKKKFVGKVGRTLNETTMNFAETPSLSKDKPNVVYIVLDDMGFASLGCYGSTINTPNLDRLAKEGLRYNNFHTTAICSATRASLLTGANHHSVGVSGVTEFATGLENNTGCINPQYGTLAEILKCYDYKTIAVGKWHLSTMEEMTESGPYTNWPLGKGFDNYYGFLASQMNQWNPTLTRDNTFVYQNKTAKEGYHLSEDLTDHAIEYVYHHEYSYPEQPFFLYLAYGAVHAPHHAPKEYIEKYKGKFDKGWDEIRKEWFENQKKLGIVNDNAELTPRNECIQPWDDLTEDEKKACARSMEVFAGFLEHTDAQIGRLIDYLEKIGILDNTVVVFLSDNGASPEGSREGQHNAYVGAELHSKRPEQTERILRNYDTIGDEYSFPHYPMGWANAGNTPFKWYKTWVHDGGIKDSMIIRYPKAIKEKGGIRRQFCHVSDITPTILDILGFEKPDYIKGVAQKPLEGTSFKYTFDDENADCQKKVQYWEMYGNRAIYKDGWKAVVNHAFNSTFAEDEWELYHLDEDYSENHNVADLYPEKLKELQEEWLIQAGKYNVFPMFPLGFHAMAEESVKLKEKLKKPAIQYHYKNVIFPHDLTKDPGLVTSTHSVTAILNRKNKDEAGVIISKGDCLAGTSFFVLNNKIKYAYNVDGETVYIAESKKELPLGKVKIKYTLVIDNETNSKVTLYIDGEEVDSVPIKKIIRVTSFGQTLKANKYSSVVVQDYTAPFEYSGELEEIIIDVASNEVDPEEQQKFAAHVE